MSSDKENMALAPRSGAREIVHRGPDYDVIIIGAGPGGLASAMLLAQSGLRVKIVERLERVGGRTSNLEADGFKFSLGPTFFNDPPILEGIFQSVGDRLDRHVELMKLDPSHRLHFGTTGRYLDCAPNIEFMEREIAKIDPDDAKNVRPYMDMNRKKYTLLQPITQKPFRSFLDWLPALKHINLFRPWSTLEDEMKRYFKNEHVRQAFSFQSRYIGMAPFQAPSLFTVLSYLEYEPGTYHPIGGCPSLCEAMANVARKMGVDIALGEDVEEIFFEGRKAKGVRTNRGSYRSHSLVINADFSRAMHRLVPDHLRRKWKNKTIAKKKFSCSTFMMYLGVEGRYDDVHHHTLFLPDDYDRNLRETHIDHTVSDDPQFYVQNASVNDPTLAPEGMSALSCMFPITNLDSKCDWDKEKHRFRALAIKQLEKVGITDLERRLRFEKITTPLDWSRSFEVHKGAVFSMAHNISQVMHFRPQNKFEDLESVYLVGGGTHPGSGLPIIFESAKITSRLLIEERGLSTGWLTEPRLESGTSAPAPAPALLCPTKLQG